MRGWVMKQWAFAVGRIAWTAFLATLASGCSPGENMDPCHPNSPATLLVVYGDASVPVDLGRLEGTREGSACPVPLDDVVAASRLPVDLGAVVVDFEAEDGFRPSSVGCAPLDGSLLSRGGADKVTGTLVWDPALGLRGCYSVQKARRILLEDAVP